MRYRRKFVEPLEFNPEDRVYGRTHVACNRCGINNIFEEVMELDIYEMYFKEMVKEIDKLRYNHAEVVDNYNKLYKEHEELKSKLESISE